MLRISDCCSSARLFISLRSSVLRAGCFSLHSGPAIPFSVARRLQRLRQLFPFILKFTDTEMGRNASAKNSYRANKILPGEDERQFVEPGFALNLQLEYPAVFNGQRNAASSQKQAGSCWQTRAMRHGWNQSCHVINYRVAEHSKRCISRQSVDDLSLIDDRSTQFGSTQLGREWRRAIAARMLT